jgi:hypothetical protein
MIIPALILLTTLAQSADEQTFWKSSSGGQAISPVHRDVKPTVQPPPPAPPEDRRGRLSSTGIAAAFLVLGATATGIHVKRKRANFLEPRRAKLNEIRLAASSEIQSTIDSIATTCEEMFAIIEQQPTLGRRCGGFIDFALDKTLRIVVRYGDLHRTAPTAARPALERAAMALTSIEASLRQQLERLMHDGLTQLVTDIDVLDARLEFESCEVTELPLPPPPD